jgi:2-polyprenyl-3-methyl-5-hydroxy-6-metoxy-1,4-benzoquinol methylase
MAEHQPIAYSAYEKIAQTYAERVREKPHNAYYERPAIRALLPAVAGLRVLDAGCGPGLMSRWLTDQGATVTGLDNSPQFIDLARAEAPAATFHQANLEAPLTMLADESFDLVVSSLVVHYLADLTAPFAEFARVLRPGGLFIFSTHHPMDAYEQERGVYFETRPITQTWRFGGTPIEMSFYVRPLSAITDALSSAGFTIERIVEPLPTDAFREADPESYAQLMQRPEFILFRVRR